MLKGFVRSARKPWNIWLVVKTSLVTSLLIFSTVPGFDKPNASLFAAKDVYLSTRDVATALWNRKPKGELSSVEAIVKRGCVKRGCGIIWKVGYLCFG